MKSRQASEKMAKVIPSPSPAHKDPRFQNPHGHVPGVTNPDGTPWLPIY